MRSSNSVPLNSDDTRFADTIIYDGTILTIDDDFSTVEAIATKDGRIIAVGLSSDLIENYGLSGQTTMINLEGKAVLPGFIDGHTHLFGYGLQNEWGFEGAQELALSYGFTTVNEKFADWNHIAALQSAEANGQMKLRINLFAHYNDGTLDENNETIIFENWFPENPPVTDPERKLRIPGIKIFVDGSFQVGRGAWAMSQPFPAEDMEGWLKDVTSNPFGDLYLEEDELIAIVKQAQDMGYQVAFHAMGDRALETVLNAVSNITDGSNTNYRHQIEHNSYSRPDLVDRYVELDTIHSVRGYFPTCQQSKSEVESFFAGDYFNTTWYVNRYSLPSRGLHVYLETDFAYNHEIGDLSHTRNINPFLHLFGLVTRSHVSPENGSVCIPEDWIAKHKITIEQALKIITIEGAYAVSQEDVIGSLEVGKFTDLIILPDSPLEIDPMDLKDLYPILTMIGGEIVYEIEDSALDFDTYGISENSGLSMNFNLFSLVLLLIAYQFSRRKMKHK
ncbi:MAG: amidohydrolase [Candidatus Kariarchaeaceae archaeon]